MRDINVDHKPTQRGPNTPEEQEQLEKQRRRAEVMYALLKEAVPNIEAAA
jgi:hypothetical protein